MRKSGILLATVVRQAEEKRKQVSEIKTRKGMNWFDRKRKWERRDQG